MDTQVVVAVISAVGSIAIAVVAGRKEAKRAPSKSGQARPLLAFAATGALLLSLTVLGVTLYLQSLPRLGYEFFSVIIYSGEPQEKGWGIEAKAFPAPAGELATKHLVDLAIPAGSNIIGTWYTLEDAVGELANFATINVLRADNTHLELSLKGRPAIKAVMRIRLHAVYTL